jgi:DUF4097 and DUF4098 domain-containing protein YvlB
MAAYSSLTITTASGSIVVTGEDRPDVVVDGQASVDEGAPGELTVHATSSDVDIRCPIGTHVRIGTASGRVDLRGRLGDARVTTKSSSMYVERVETVELRTSSGSIDVESCAGSCRLKTTSGSVRVEDAGEVDISTVSSTIGVASAGGGRVQTVSGSIELGLNAAAALDVRSISGSVRVTVPGSVRPDVRMRTVSGKARCDCDEGDDCRLAVSTVSGSIKVSSG